MVVWEVVWHVLALLCALAPAAAVTRFVPRVLPGYYSQRVVLLQIFVGLLFAVVCAWGIFFCAQRSDSPIVDMGAPMFFITSVAAMWVKHAGHVRAHYEFMGYVESAAVTEDISIDDLELLVRRYVWYYPGVELTALKVGPHVRLVVRGKLIASLRVIGHSPAVALNTLRRAFSNELKLLGVALESVSVVRNAPGQKFTVRINAANVY